MKNNSKIIKQLKKGGYAVHVRHLRAYETVAEKVINRSLYPEAEIFKLKEVGSGERVSRRSYRVKTDVLIRPSARGGCTEVEVVASDGRRFIGYSNCSRSDNFCRREGVYRALKEALVNLKENRSYSE